MGATQGKASSVPLKPESKYQMLVLKGREENGERGDKKKKACGWAMPQ